MLSLLIVDDEVSIADGLYEMLQEVFQDQLVVRRCYSFYEAQRILEQNRVDILMTDIEMPDVSGLELHQWVSARWPMMRVIYLTGYSDFSYAHRALKQHALAYVLKSEGDEVIVSAIRGAIESIQDESVALLLQARSRKVRSERIHQLIYHARHGGMVTPEQLTQAFEAAHLPFSVDAPILMGYCYFEGQSQQLSQCMNLMEELTGERLHLLLTEMSARALLLIAQPAVSESADTLRSILEAVQSILEKQGDLMTVCLLAQPIAFSELAVMSDLILEEINRTSPALGELLSVNPAATPGTAQSPPQREEWSEALDRLKRLNEYLLTGQRDLYMEEEAHLWELLHSSSSQHHSRLIYGTLATSLLHSANALPVPQKICRRLKEISNAGLIRHSQETSGELHHLAENIFEVRGQNKNNRQLSLVVQVNDYIAGHMDDDLSLTTVADAVHFHPVYLSRIYKETAGISLSEYIADQRLKAACSLLCTTAASVAAIAKATGFASPNYFSRWFRKQTGMTPQEYRDQSAT